MHPSPHTSANPQAKAAHADASSSTPSSKNPPNTPSFTTGEAARECGVTVRTVQYYDRRGLLKPSGASSGGRRLYSQADIERLRIICFLRELGLPLDSIAKILNERHPEQVINLLLERQQAELRTQLDQTRGKLTKLNQLQSGLGRMDGVTVETIGSVATTMDTNTQLATWRKKLILAGLPLSALQVSAIWAWLAKGKKWPAALWLAAAVPFGVIGSREYLRKVAYMCPQCHETFQPEMREAVFARHTPYTRRLTCPHCGEQGFCVEVWVEDATNKGDKCDQ